MSKENPETGDLFIWTGVSKPSLFLVGKYGNRVWDGLEMDATKLEQFKHRNDRGEYVYLGNIKDIWTGFCNDVIEQYQSGILKELE